MSLHRSIIHFHNIITSYSFITKINVDAPTYLKSKVLQVLQRRMSKAALEITQKDLFRVKRSCNWLEPFKGDQSHPTRNATNM